MCGDYTDALYIDTTTPDTTPRVRGLHGLNIAINGLNRYNPACAGTTGAAWPRWRLYPIQPRVCGDYEVWLMAGEYNIDTTPRVRGLPHLLVVVARA